MKNLIVQKYGGTSVGSIERIQHVARQIVKTKNNGNQVIVVVSAMGNTTDKLVRKAKKINPDPENRELDMLLATGEQVSISLLAMALQTLKQYVVSLTGFQCGIITDAEHKNARIDRIDTERIKKELAQDRIVIVAGFQGINTNHDITTLGRGGSDITAVALAAALNANRCEIYTDVDGVYTADPRIVANARLLEKISYDEMLELAGLGAKVLHARSVEVAKKFNIPLVVTSSFHETSGTKIMEVNSMEQVTIKGVTLDNNIAKIALLAVPGTPEIPSKLFSTLLSQSINVDMFSQNLNQPENQLYDIHFTIQTEDLHEAIAVSEKVARAIGAKKVVTTETVSKLSIVGIGIARNTPIVHTFFECFRELGIGIQMFSTSEIKLSCIIDQNHSTQALRYVHDRFLLSQ